MDCYVTEYLRKQLFVTGGYNCKLNTSLRQQWGQNESV